MVGRTLGDLHQPKCSYEHISSAVLPESDISPIRAAAAPPAIVNSMIEFESGEFALAL
jgi:hypothetical protein